MLLSIFVYGFLLWTMSRLSVKSFRTNTFKYMVKLNGQWVSPSQAMSAGQALFDSLIVSPTKTGVFMEIRSTATPEELKQIEARMKGNTAKKPAK